MLGKPLSPRHRRAPAAAVLPNTTRRKLPSRGPKRTCKPESMAERAWLRCKRSVTRLLRLPTPSTQKRRPRFLTSGKASMDEITRRFLVTGKVQGVYFRHSARIEAKRLKVSGLARNLSDGSVEVVARGSRAAVEALRQWLHRGPAAAQVESVREEDASEAQRSGIPTEFEVF
ncbi:MAG: acylphosphatase [Gammaproteobacteria bacterium]|jgi:acylphosphatase|nr:acylphosphatase [Gammaproteobacteria bacterium]